MKSEKEDFEQEMCELTTRNEQLRCNNEVQTSALVGTVDDDGEAGSDYFAMYEDLRSNYEVLADQNARLGKEGMATRDELVKRQSNISVYFLSSHKTESSD